ncbi:hypothetical protein ACFLWC_03800 [Chloroflexota bacterium]
MFTLRGKLYNDEEQFMANVSYRLLEGALPDIWGELIPIEDKPLSDSSGYIMELENNRKIKCYLQACLHRPMSIPASCVYRFTGNYPVYIN